MAAIFGFIGQDGTKYTNSHSLNLTCQSYYNLTYYLSLHPRGPGDVRRCSHPSHNGVVNTEQSVCYLYNMLRYRVVLFFHFFQNGDGSQFGFRGQDGLKYQNISLPLNLPCQNIKFDKLFIFIACLVIELPYIFVFFLNDDGGHFVFRGQDGPKYKK